MMMLEHLRIAVSYCQWMFCPYHKLICVTWMLIVVNHVGYKRSEDICGLEERAHVSSVHQEVHPLQTVNYVYLIMIRVVLEVTIGYLCREIDQALDREVVQVVEVVHVADLIHHELQAMTRDH